jgi:acyl-CoA thioester hydrolase
VAGIPIYRTPILAEWIDYNGHLRDAYYAVIISLAIDALMDRVGLDEGYRKRTGGTLYTLEMHFHYLHEVKHSDTAEVDMRILAVDRKRIQAAFELKRAGQPEIAATAEAMLLHVRQHEGKVSVAPFPDEVATALTQLELASAALKADGPLSRCMELRPSSRPT